jgi:hypothetical protein
MILDDIKTGLRDRALDLAMFLYPNGTRDGKEWRIGDVHGNPSRKGKGGSLGIVIQGIKAGTWKDFGTGEGGTTLDLWAMRFGYHGTEGWVTRAGEECAQWLGGTFEKRLPDGTTKPVNGTNGHHSAPKPTAPARAPQAPRPRHAATPLPEMPSYAEDWKKCVGAMNDAMLQSLGTQRGYSAGFCEWLRAEALIGLHETRHGLALALPVHNEKGEVIAAHVRNRQKNNDGTPISPAPPKWQYRYHGEQSPGTRPLIIGEIAKATKLHVFESQWDAFAVIDRLGLWRDSAEWPPIAFIVTRGASNAATLSPFIQEGKALVLWPQNDQPAENGKVPAEEWVKGIVGLAGNVPCRRVATPAGFEDPNDWLKKAPEADALKLFEAISQAVPARTTKLPPMRDMAFAIRPENRSPVPPEVINGLLHRGSKMVIGGTSKGRKSFSLLDLAVSVATGEKWWGFDCVQGRILYLNFEIQQPFLEERVKAIADAKGVVLPPGHFQTMCLRGITDPIEDLAGDLTKYILDLEPFSGIVFDPVYKLMAGKDENKAGDVGMIMAHLEKISVETGASIIFGAHYSKGNQSAKESIDRIGGSGVFARDPDAILTMTGHEVENAFTVEATLRNYKPIDPFVVGWQYPLFYRDDTGLDPAALRLPAGKKERGSREAAARFEGGPLRKNSRIVPALEMLRAVYTEIPRAMRMTDCLRKAAMRCTDGMGQPLKEDTAKKYFFTLKDAGYLVKQESGSDWITTQKGDAYLDPADDGGAGAEKKNSTPE